MRNNVLGIIAIAMMIMNGCSIGEKAAGQLPEMTPTTEHLQHFEGQEDKLLPTVKLQLSKPHTVNKQSSDHEDTTSKSKGNHIPGHMYEKQSTSTAQSMRYKTYSEMGSTTSQQLNIAQLWKKYPEIFKFRAASRNGKKVALTFDDVPDRTVTPVILDILKEHGIQATFFIEGHRAKANPDMIKRMVAEGHIIGNHSYDHPLLTKTTMSSFVKQIQNTETIISNITGYKPRFFRPPFGEITEEQLQWAGDHGYIVVNWDVDSNDWRGIPSSRVEQNIMSQVSSGSIILQHAGGGGKPGYLQNTVQALPKVIRQLREQNYQFVTLPDLLHDHKEKRDY
ncbi:polysaccharide deacetylase family protein [Paenibacillus marinisediminis]